jgi:hypothetical protein
MSPGEGFVRHFAGKKILRSFVLGATFTASITGSSAAQSVWKKLKIAALQQACRGGDQQACQELAKMGQGQPQSGQQQSQPGQPQPAQASARPGQQQPSGGQTNDFGPFKPPAGTKIEEKIMAPLQQGARFTVSPHGVHVATVTNSGSRTVVIYDGVEGPKFDQMLGTVVFSPDGNRYAYCARFGDQYAVMVDGKELVRSSENSNGSVSDQSCDYLGFTSNSKHVFFHSYVSSPSSTLTFTRLVFDGKSIPCESSENANDPRKVAFSPDGDHYAYVCSDPKKQRPWVLIVDGKPAAYQAGAPQWTADSKHLYTQSQSGGFTELLYDGKPIAKAFNFKVYIPPVGDMVVVVVSGGSYAQPVNFLVVGGKKVPGSETSDRTGFVDVVFSPDGKHYAAKHTTLHSTDYLITDGKRGQEYVTLDKVAFTPDSSKLVFQGVINKIFLVVGDQEYENGGLAPAMSGGRVGSILAGARNTSLLMDGKVTSLAVGGEDLSFTPDGLHYAYFGGDSSMGRHLAIDGVPQPQSLLPKESRINPWNSPADVKYVFSPDSKHVAHFALAPSPNAGAQFGIFLDGKYIPANAEGGNGHMFFSPDSKHLFWVRQYGDHPFRVFIDGQPLVEAFNAGGDAPQWWDFGPDGTLSFLAQDDKSLKRITITLPSETSLTALTGGASVFGQGN